MGFKVSDRDSMTHVEGDNRVFQPDVFASFWTSSREAEVAEFLRQLMIELLGRPAGLMLEPTERFGIWPNCDHDSLDRIEFIVDLQFKYKIDISDADGFRWFTTNTFHDTVRDIMMRLEDMDV